MKIFFISMTVSVSVCIPFTSVSANAVPDELAEVTVAADSYVGGEITDYDITFTIENANYSSSALMFYNVLAEDTPGGAASFIDFSNNDTATVTLSDDLANYIELDALEQRYVDFTVTSDIPPGTYTFTINDAKNNKSPGGYGYYQVLGGVIVDPDDEATYTTSNEILLRNSDFGTGNRMDKPEVKSIKKRQATVNWSESAYITAATKFKLELRKKNGTLIKRFKNISGDAVKKVLKKQYLQSGKTYKVRMKAEYPTGDVTEWSTYKKFTTL